MMTEDGFRQLVTEIMSLGYDAGTAAQYAGYIGDTPIRDQDDNIVVQDDHGKVLARLKLKSFEDAGGTGE